MSLTRDEISIKVGKKIREIRVSKGLTIERVASDADIDYTQLSRIELGKINTSIYQVYRISTSLCIPLLRLFEDLR